MKLNQEVRLDQLFDKSSSPLMCSPLSNNSTLLKFIEDNAVEINSQLPHYGALLFRGFNSDHESEFGAAAKLLFPTLLPYMNQSTPRTQLGANVYTATEYPPEQTIPLHNENAYCNNWPKQVLFYCAIAASEGGQTPLADSRKVYEAIPEEIREEFIAKKVQYLRTYGLGVDLSWQTVFQTDSRAEVERHLQNSGVAYHWDGEILQTREICPAIMRHDKTHEVAWFNQAHLFHISRLTEELQEYMLAEFGEQHLPRNAFFGDGTTIPNEYLEEIRRAFNQQQKQFDWQQGDFLLVDNILFAHGRAPFSGGRRVLVAMGG